MLLIILSIKKYKAPLVLCILFLEWICFFRSHRLKNKKSIFYSQGECDLSEFKTHSGSRRLSDSISDFDIGDHVRGIFIAII